MSDPVLFLLVTLAVLVIILLVAGLYTVEQQSYAVIERFGRYLRVSAPGLHVRIPIVDRIAGRVTIRIRELQVQVNTKTHDNVFVDLDMAVQFQVRNESDVWNAFYRLSDPEGQMESFIYDTVRAKVPTMDLDQVFENKDDIAEAVRNTLAEQMEGYGYSIVQSLVNDVRPAANVVQAMNEIVAQERLRRAAEHRGDADKIIVVKAAEADAESKRLAGEGIAAQRKAIVQGYEESVTALQQATGVDPREVMSVVLMTQYFDALRDMGTGSRSSVVFATHTPGEVNNIQQQMLEALLAARTMDPENPVRRPGSL